MQKTKRKIITTTIDLLNQNGYSKFSLPQIAKALGISLGNLTYHFPKKDLLMLSVYNRFKEDLAEITKEYQSLVDLEGINNQLKAFYQFQQDYRFFYLDLLELEKNYSFIAEHHHPYIENHIKGIYNHFLFNVGSQSMKIFDNLKVYEQLAQQFWMTVVFFPMQLAFRGKKGTLEEMLTAIWALLMPYLTDKGKTKLQQIVEEKNTSIHYF